MKDLLRRLHREVFILDCVEELPETIDDRRLYRAARWTRTPWRWKWRKGSISTMYLPSWMQPGIHISSMRNRANRLEEMFVNLVEGAA